MRIFLIRHGETVDNVAGLFAGSRDSALTSHGVLQARRLATHLAGAVRVGYLFSSDLGRAVKTAESVCVAQNGAHQSGLAVVQVSELREKHFGTGEGVKYGAKGPKTEHEGAESLDAMKSRVDRFLDDYVVPLMVGDDQACVCIVAHGIILGVLFTAVCARMAPSAISVPPEAQSASVTSVLRPSWSNTGYLEGVIVKSKSSGAEGRGQDDEQFSWRECTLVVESVNSVDHLQGLRKTRGGIGSAQFDEKQKTMDSFFKPTTRKRKLEETGEVTPHLLRSLKWYVTNLSFFALPSPRST